MIYTLAILDSFEYKNTLQLGLQMNYSPGRDVREYNYYMDYKGICKGYNPLIWAQIGSDYRPEYIVGYIPILILGYTNVVFGTNKRVIFREPSSIQQCSDRRRHFHCIQWHSLYSFFLSPPPFSPRP